MTKKISEEEDPLVMTERLFQTVMESFYKNGPEVERMVLERENIQKFEKRTLYDILNITFGFAGFEMRELAAPKLRRGGIIDGKTAWERMLEPGRLFVKVMEEVGFEKEGVVRDLDVTLAASKADRRYFIPFLPQSSIDIPIRKIVEMLKLGLMEEGLYIDGQRTFRLNPYMNNPIPINFDHDGLQMCSAPYIVVIYGIISKMTQAEKIFEGGVGCGWHIAYKGMLHPDARIFGCDIKPGLVDMAIKNISSLEAGEGKQHSLSERIMISEGNCLDPSSSELFIDNRPYDFIYLTFMVPQMTDVSCYVESLAPGGIFVAPIGISNKGILRLYYKRQDGSLEVPLEIAPVAFVEAINPNK